MLRDRKNLRKFVQFDIDVKILSTDMPAVVQKIEGHSFKGQNFSVGGLGVETTMPMKAGTHLRISFVLPGEKRRLTLDATIQVVTEFVSQITGKKMYNVGLKFVAVTPEDYMYMSNYMASTFLLF